jgi:hypothetical protein
MNCWQALKGVYIYFNAPMTVSVAVGIIYLQNKEPIWQAA